ncbi:hypothetical protein OPS25_04080 [Alteromonas ponticola]|uniref:Lipoprotein n=1 Tax=Alteromonas aquimaris TaxID=2998417 RepID=A0ABT3P4J6_9ALTE|nr:hypothetical protein [Alteromonas aquimaris]MCW8107681.1 hypothetical protein [Alteromonas aquimaris]
MNKFYKNLAVVVPLLFGVVGCNSTADSDRIAKNSNLEADDGQVCKMEKRIGSNRMTRVCHTAEEREQMEEAAREGWTRLQKGSMTTGADGR